MESLICKKLTVSAYCQTSFASQSTLRGQQRSHCLVNLLQPLNVKWLLTDTRATPSDLAGLRGGGLRGGGTALSAFKLSNFNLSGSRQIQLFLLYYPAMLLLVYIIYLFGIGTVIYMQKLPRQVRLFLDELGTKKTFFTSILKGLVALI